MRVWIGRGILAVALIHSLFAIVFYRSASTVFWFIVSGALALMLGGLVHHVERLGIALPAFLPWSLLALTVVGCLMMPLSAWLLLVPVAGMYVRERRATSSGAEGN